MSYLFRYKKKEQNDYRILLVLFPNKEICYWPSIRDLFLSLNQPWCNYDLDCEKQRSIVIEILLKGLGRTHLQSVTRSQIDMESSTRTRLLNRWNVAADFIFPMSFIVFKNSLSTLFHLPVEEGNVQLYLRGADFLQDWEQTRFLLSTIHAVGGRFPSRRVNVFLESEFLKDRSCTHLSEKIGTVANELYNMPWVRLFYSIPSVFEWDKEDALKSVCARLRIASERGLYLHCEVPLMASNQNLLLDLIKELLDASRGGTFEFTYPFLGSTNVEDLPNPTMVAEFFHEIYLSNVLNEERVDSLKRLKKSLLDPAFTVCCLHSLGQHVTVTSQGYFYRFPLHHPDNDIPLGEALTPLCEESLKVWKSALWGAKERFAPQTLPSECNECEWVPFCGGLCCRFRSFIEKTPIKAMEKKDIKELYCLPRKTLLEAMLWDVMEEACSEQVGNEEIRHKISLMNNTVQYN